MHATSQAIIDAIPTATRDQIAPLYAEAILAHAPVEDWPVVNRAIIAKWCTNALVYIKERAWRIVHEQGN